MTTEEWCIHLWKVLYKILILSMQFGIYLCIFVINIHTPSDALKANLLAPEANDDHP